MEAEPVLSGCVLSAPQLAFSISLYTLSPKLSSEHHGGGGILKTSKEQNAIFIGRKPPMNYVLTVITCFNTPDTKEVTLKARGQAITTAVDVAEITRSRFMKDLKVSRINVGTDTVQLREGGTRNISTIEITLSI